MKKNLVVIGIVWLFLTGAANALDGQDQSQKPVSPFTQGSRPRAAAALGEGFWDDRFFEAGGTEGSVNAIVINNGILYAGGSFTCIGGIVANSVAKWDGTTWSALGPGLPNVYVVDTLAVSGTDLYAGVSGGGYPSTDIYKWDGTIWTSIHSAYGSHIMALAFYGTDLYAAGYWFPRGAGAPWYFFIKWDGTTWSDLGSGLGDVKAALAVSGTDLYVGGNFTGVGGVTANSVAKWDGTTWSALGSGISGGGVSALAVSGTDLYAGGSFTTAGGVSVNSIAKWNGTTWSALGSGLNGAVYELAISGTALYVGGIFTTAGGVSANHIAKWDGTAWSALNSGISGNVNALAVSGTDLFVGGNFTTAGGVSIKNIAKWNNNTWSAMGRTNGLGMNYSVKALAVSGDNLYAAGEFTSAGDISAKNVAQWDGTTWSAMGTGMNYAVRALAVSGTDLYAGGDFTTAGGVSANYIAKWDGTKWSALGSGVSYSVSALAVSGNNLYVGGGFYTAGGVSANHIAKWDGTKWSALGSGMSGTVFALAVSGTDLYAAGNFTTAGGVAANHIAKWDGISWSALGSGTNGTYYFALAVFGPDLYVGGDFTMAGGVEADHIAKWNGTTWSTLDSGMDHSVSALAVSGTNLYAGGYFTTAGGVATNHIAQWDGTIWSPLGSGLDSSVRALSVFGIDICAGGDFKLAGGVSSNYFAIWHRNLVLTSPVGGEIWEAGTTHPITWAAQPAVGDVKLEYSMDGGTNWTTIIASTPNDGSCDWLVPNSPSGNCLVRISENVGGGPADTSDAVFSIVTQPTIILISPNGGERWYSGFVHNIAWASSLNGGSVKLEYSTDSGATYATIIASTVNTGSYAWTVPIASSKTCLVRVSEAASGSPSDASDAAFAIGPLPPVISLNRATLYYGAIVDGVATRAQTIVISNTGGGTLAWTAAADRSWITVGPGSGINGGVIAVGVNPAGQPVGTQTGIVTVSDSSGLADPRTVGVTLTVKAAGTSSAPLLFMDSPRQESETLGITGAIPVTGWAVDDIEVVTLEIKREAHAFDPPEAIGPDKRVLIGYGIFIDGARPDIEGQYAGYAMNYRGGWGYMLLTNMLPGQGNGTYKLYATATDIEGNQRTVGPATITCDNANAVKPFGTIDSPEQGGAAAGNPYLNFGWVLTPLTKTVPKDGSTILVYVDGVNVGNLGTAPNVYNQYREDVSKAFPGLNNAGAPGVGGPVGAYFLDTTKYPNGMHTISWVATDDAGAADGIGSRYFNIVNTGTAGKSVQRSASGEWAVSGLGGDPDASEVSEFFGGQASSFSRIEDLLGLGMTFEPLPVRTGFDPRGESQSLIPDNFGVYRIEIPEVNRLEIDLKSGYGLTGRLSDRLRYSGYLIVGEELRPLPIGSTLDRRAGRFYWMPGPGFVGPYDFDFIEADASGSLRLLKVRVEIRPKR